MRQSSSLLSLAAVAGLALSFCGTARGQTISMAGAPATPELHAPFLYSARPSTSFQFTIPATGQAPLAFAATGLPTGLQIGADTGTIAGMMPAAGTYPVTVTVSNSSGKATATYTLASSNTYALTPPMGWNSYDSFGAGVKEQEFLDAAMAVKTYLAPYGWNTVVIDYLWFADDNKIDTNGRWIPATTKWPGSASSQGLKYIGDKVHAMGLNFGIHIMRGIPRMAYTANSTIAGATYKAQDAGNMSDTCPWENHNYGVHGDTAAGQAWYDSIFAQYASWGLDFVKVDDMVSGSNYHQTEVNAIRAAIDKSGRSIVLSLSPGPMQTRDTANLNMNANMWRTVNDFWDTNGLSNLTQVFDAANNWQMQSSLVPGHWPDCDMLPLGYIGPRSPVGGGNRQNSMSALSHGNQVTVMSLWGVMPSPLMFGGNPTHLMGDTWTTALLTNPEVLAINQDPSGSHAKRISASGNAEVWARDLSGGRKAVALFNLGSGMAMVSATFAQLGITGAPAVRDVWQRMDVTGMTTSVSASLAGNSAAMYLLSPPGSSGTGGDGGFSSGQAGAGGGGTAGNAGGSSGTTGKGGGAGGATGTAGTSGQGGGSGTTASAGTSGFAGADGLGGTSGAGTAGTSGGTGTGAGPAGTGATGTGNAGTSGGTSGGSLKDTGSGCSCDATPGAPPSPLVLLAGVLAAFRPRRRPSR